MKQNKVVKLLLLGCGADSGKDVISKQMKIIHLDGFDEEERIAYKETISYDILTAIQTLVNQTTTFEYLLLPENTPRAHHILSLSSFSNPFILTPSVADDIMALWQDPAIQKAFFLSSEYQLNDYTQYFMSSVPRISQAGYIPTEQDVLRTTLRTTGILETIFEVEDIIFKLIDVGGLHSDKRKWIHFFDDVTVIIFCVSLSEYDLSLYEDQNANRLCESLQLFSEICNRFWSVKTSFFIFFTKKDIFAEKIKRVPLTVCFPDYTGSQSFVESSDFIVQKFLAVSTEPRIYPFFLCETDTTNTIIVFNVVIDIIFETHLNRKVIRVLD